MNSSLLHQSISVNPLCLGRKSLKQRLESYYSLIAPDAIKDETEWNHKFNLIYEKYGGSVKGEKALAAKLCKKYGTTVRLRLLGENGKDLSSKIDPSKGAEDPVAVVPKKEESWYHISQSQQKSGVVDFTSKDFDPMTALICTQTKLVESNPFVKDSPILDNIAKFPPYLPLCDPLQRTRAKRKVDSSSSLSPQKKCRKLPMFTSIASTYEHAGPFSLLYNTFIKKQRIRIMIRYNDCVRSTLTGYLLAFDKHLNMILRDVDEVYTPRVTRVYKDKNYTKGELEYRRRTSIMDGNTKKKVDNNHRRTISSSCNTKDNTPLLKVKQRHFHQLLVRGDNVVMVWRVSAERSAWPKTMMSPERSQYQAQASDILQGQDDAENHNLTRCSSHVGTPGSLLIALQSKYNKAVNYEQKF